MLGTLVSLGISFGTNEAALVIVHTANNKPSSFTHTTISFWAIAVRKRSDSNCRVRVPAEVVAGRPFSTFNDYPEPKFRCKAWHIPVETR